MCDTVFRGLVCIHSEHCFHFFRRSKQSQPSAAQAQVVQHAAADQKRVVQRLVAGWSPTVAPEAGGPTLTQRSTCFPTQGHKQLTLMPFDQPQPYLSILFGRVEQWQKHSHAVDVLAGEASRTCLRCPVSSCNVFRAGLCLFLGSLTGTWV